MSVLAYSNLLVSPSHSISLITSRSLSLSSIILFYKAYFEIKPRVVCLLLSKFSNCARFFLPLRLEKLESKIEAVMKVLPKHEEPDINEICHGTICLAKFTLDDKYAFYFFISFAHFIKLSFIDISFYF